MPMGNDAMPYRRTKLRRTINAVLAGAIKYGIGPAGTQLLTTRGRTTGFLRTTPVTLVEDETGRFLVAPYGEVGWVRNIRRDGFATLRHGGWIELVSVVETDTAEAAPVLRSYLQHPSTALFASPYFDASPDSPVEAFAEEAARHPVFRIVRSTTIRL
jgi:hypothetical protein